MTHSFQFPGLFNPCADRPGARNLNPVIKSNKKRIMPFQLADYTRFPIRCVVPIKRITGTRKNHMLHCIKTAGRSLGLFFSKQYCYRQSDFIFQFPMPLQIRNHGVSLNVLNFYLLISLLFNINNFSVTVN